MRKYEIVFEQEPPEEPRSLAIMAIELDEQASKLLGEQNTTDALVAALQGLGMRVSLVRRIIVLKRRDVAGGN